MKEKKWLLWIAPAIVLIIIVLWQILFRVQFPLFTIMGIDDDAELYMVEVMSTEIEFPFEHIYHSEETEVIAQIEEDLRNVRCRVTGAASSIKDPFAPCVGVTIGWKDGGEEFLLMFSIDAEGEIVIPKNNYAIYCRVDDGFLHEYLSALVESVPSDDELPHVWNYEPSDDPVKTVESAICGQIEKSYCNAVGVYSAIIDWQEKDRAVKEYTDYREGWTEEYLDTHLSVVWVSYFISYDSTKTNLQGGDVEQIFYLLLNDETQTWELWEEMCPGQFGVYA